MLFFYRFWRGFLRIEIKGDITEKLLNICAKNGIPLWNIKRRGKAIRCYIAVGDFKRLPRLLAKSGLRVHIIDRYGLPFFTERYKKRYGIPVGTAVFFAFLQPGDTVMGMNLQQGGHLSHGSPVNISGKYFNVVPYGVNHETEMIDYDEMRRIALECKPKMIIAGASAYSRIIDFKRCREIADEVGAYLMVDMAHIAGLVAAGLHPSPVPYADVVTTTTHKTLRGPRGGLILCKEKYAAQIDKAIFPGTQGGPLMHIIAAKAVALGEALTPEFREYQQQILKNSKALCTALQDEGFDIVSGGTDNHLILLKLIKNGITGKELEHRLDEVHITANKNTVPNDPQSPFVTSGLRVGTPAVTTRGFKEAEMKDIARWIALCANDFEPNKEIITGEVTELCSRYPIY